MFLTDLRFRQQTQGRHSRRWLERRIAATVLLLSLVLGVWLTPKLLRDAESPLNKPPAETLVGAGSESDIAPVTEAAATSAAADIGVSNSDRQIELARSTRIDPPGFVRGSVITEALTGYLVEDGLAESDSERIVRVALRGLADCRNAFPESSSTDQTDRSVCDRNFIEETGMQKAFRRLSAEVLVQYAREGAQER